MHFYATTESPKGQVEYYPRGNGIFNVSVGGGGPPINNLKVARCSEAGGEGGVARRKGKKGTGQKLHFVDRSVRFEPADPVAYARVFPPCTRIRASRPPVEEKIADGIPTPARTAINHKISVNGVAVERERGRASLFALLHNSPSREHERSYVDILSMYYVEHMYIGGGGRTRSGERSRQALPDVQHGRAIYRPDDRGYNVRMNNTRGDWIPIVLNENNTYRLYMERR